MEITIEITNFCENECDYCSSNATPLNAKYIDYEDVISFLKCITEKIDRINISGGEPLAHPQFYKILRACEMRCKDVWVYTNALKQIRFNASVIPEVNVEANVCLIPGRKVYLPKKVNKIHLLQLVKQGRAEDNELIPGSYHVSSNISGGSECDCSECKHKFLLQADGKIVQTPCKKSYED
jgi:organic radical activating enzyme